MAKMRCEPSAELEERYPGRRPARPSAWMTDSTRHTILVEAPLGDATRPMDDVQLRGKFLAQAGPVIGIDQAEYAADLVMTPQMPLSTVQLLQASPKRDFSIGICLSR
jgi:2-methylcitrate dehydratase PrpD